MKIPIGYLIGTSHRGSTLMAHLMNAHPEIASVGEVGPNRTIERRDPGSAVCSCGERVDACPFWDRVFREVQAQGLPFSPYHWSNRYRYAQPALHRLLTQRSGHRCVNVLRRVAGAIIPWHRRKIALNNEVNVAFVRTVLALHNARVFFDSTKSLVRVEHLMKVDRFDVRVVRVVRDVRAFVLSRKRKGVPAAAAAAEWRDFQLAADDFVSRLSADRVLTVRYENLCGDRDRALRSIHEFLGVAPITPPSALCPRDGHILGNRLRAQDVITVRLDEKWREELSRPEKDVALRIAGELSQRFGYENGRSSGA